MEPFDAIPFTTILDALLPNETRRFASAIFFWPLQVVSKHH